MHHRRHVGQRSIMCLAGGHKTWLLTFTQMPRVTSQPLTWQDRCHGRDEKRQDDSGSGHFLGNQSGHHVHPRTHAAPNAQGDQVHRGEHLCQPGAVQVTRVVLHGVQGFGTQHPGVEAVPGRLPLHPTGVQLGEQMAHRTHCVDTDESQVSMAWSPGFTEEPQAWCHQIWRCPPKILQEKGKRAKQMLRCQ